MSSPNPKFGKYEIVKRIGAGATSRVYHARRLDDGREVALKILQPSPTLSGEWVKRFEREAHLLEQLSHPNTVEFLDFGQEAGRWFLVMELVEGRLLREWVGKRPGAAFLARCGAQIARGLKAAHDLGLVHRDLKPENVMVTRTGSLKILDFGAARPAVGSLASLPTHLNELTLTGVVVGTPRYLAPEQLRGEAPTPAVDLFLLGLCLFELAAGRHPFASSFTHEVIAGILESPTPDLLKWRADLSPDLVRWIGLLLSKDPATRPTAEVAAAEFKSLALVLDRPSA
jgi:serine/threonine-protein kinase